MYFSLLSIIFFSCFISSPHKGYGTNYSNPLTIKGGGNLCLSLSCTIYDNSKNEIDREELQEISELEYENFTDKNGSYRFCSEQKIEKYIAANSPDELKNLFRGSPKEIDEEDTKIQVFFFVIKDENKNCIAFSPWALKSDEMGVNFGQIKRFHIKPEYQRDGIGMKFLVACLTEIEKGVSYIKVHASGYSTYFYLKSLTSCLEQRRVIRDKNLEKELLNEFKTKVKRKFLSTCLYSLDDKIVYIPSRHFRGRVIIKATEKVVLPSKFYANQLVLLCPHLVIEGNAKTMMLLELSNFLTS